MVVWECLCRTLKISPTCGAWEDHFFCGRVGWAFAVQQGPNLHAAHWASWADALKMVQERHPGVAEIIVGALEGNSESPSIQF